MGTNGLTNSVSPLVPILEELGWRGYILDRLQERYSALAASLIIGVMWACWHIPTFFLKGSVLTMVAIGSIPFWLYFVNIVLVSVIFTWIYNNTGRSTLSAILLHTVLEILTNFGMWAWFSEKIIYNTLLLLVVVVGIVTIWGPKRLSASRKR
jgi:membrane protease YdiL (CAAX protease family)